MGRGRHGKRAPWEEDDGEGERGGETGRRAGERGGSVLEYFSVSRPIRGRIRDGGGRDAVVDAHFDPPPQGPAPSDRAPFRSLYVTTRNQLEHLAESETFRNALILITPDVKRHLEALPQFPREAAFGDIAANETWMRQGNRRPTRVAIINGMGSSIGDSIVGLRAMRIFRDHFAARGVTCRVDVFRRDPRNHWWLYRRHPAIDRVLALPTSLHSLFSYDMMVNFENIPVEPTFNDRPMIDYFLDKLGMTSSQVPAALKRAELCFDVRPSPELKAELEALRADGRRVVLLHPEASAIIRCIPAQYCRRLVDDLQGQRALRIITAIPTAGVLDDVVDLSHVSKTSLDFAALVSQVDAVVTADTAPYHIADAFDVPAVVLFTTIAPDLRCRYYPRTVPVQVPVPEAWKGRHMGGDPQSLHRDQEAVFEAVGTAAVIDALDRAFATPSRAASAGVAGVRGQPTPLRGPVKPRKARRPSPG